MKRHRRIPSSLKRIIAAGFGLFLVLLAARIGEPEVLVWISRERTSTAPVRLQEKAQLTGEQTRVAFSLALPPFDGRRLRVTVVEVTYGPRESSPAHSHPCPVIAYVVEGAVRTQVKGEAEVIHKAGESFYEAPKGVHLVSANASDKRPAKFVAYFVCDRDTPLTVAPAKILER